jgi:hypothetical protein
MRRSLVVTDESARHPFLASLPPHVRSGKPEKPARHWLRVSRDDIRGFFLAYVGCFVAASLFIM